MEVSSYVNNKRRRILLVGSTGQVGWELQRTLSPIGDVIAISRNTQPLAIDLTDPNTIRNTIKEIRPHVVINAAAYTAVDKAEDEPELTRKVNGIAPGILAEESKQGGALFIHYSTDYVFDGEKSEPYTEEDQPNPTNVYGKTKFEGENTIQSVGGAYIILRTSWVYGLRGQNFLRTILRLAKERKTLNIVDDQIGSPTWSRLIAEATAQMLVRLLNEGKLDPRHSGIYHLTAAGYGSWFEFARQIISKIKLNQDLKLKDLHPISSDEYPTAASRPKYSVLANKKIMRTFGITMPSWQSMLDLCMDAYPDISE